MKAIKRKELVQDALFRCITQIPLFEQPLHVCLHLRDARHQAFHVMYARARNVNNPATGLHYIGIGFTIM